MDSTHWDYYTFQGVKLMARAGLDLGALMGSESLKPQRLLPLSGSGPPGRQEPAVFL